MEATTVLRMSTGQSYEVEGSYDDTRAYLAARTMSQDTGVREVKLTDGRRVEVNIGAVVAKEEGTAAKREKVGFA